MQPRGTFCELLEGDDEQEVDQRRPRSSLQGDACLDDGTSPEQQQQPCSMQPQLQDAGHSGPLSPRATDSAGGAADSDLQQQPKPPHRQLLFRPHRANNTGTFARQRRAPNTKLGPGPLIVKPSQPSCGSLRERKQLLQAKAQQEVAVLQRCHDLMAAAAAAGAAAGRGSSGQQQQEQQQQLLAQQVPACSAPVGLHLVLEDPPSLSPAGAVRSPLLLLGAAVSPCHTMSEPQRQGTAPAGATPTAAAADGGMRFTPTAAAAAQRCAGWGAAGAAPTAAAADSMEVDGVADSPPLQRRMSVDCAGTLPATAAGHTAAPVGTAAAAEAAAVNSCPLPTVSAADRADPVQHAQQLVSEWRQPSQQQQQHYGLQGATEIAAALLQGPSLDRRGSLHPSPFLRVSDAGLQQEFAQLQQEQQEQQEQRHSQQRRQWRQQPQQQAPPTVDMLLQQLAGGQQQLLQHDPQGLLDSLLGSSPGSPLLAQLQQAPSQAEPHNRCALQDHQRHHHHQHQHQHGVLTSASRQQQQLHHVQQQQRQRQHSARTEQLLQQLLQRRQQVQLERQQLQQQRESAAAAAAAAAGGGSSGAGGAPAQAGTLDEQTAHQLLDQLLQQRQQQPRSVNRLPSVASSQSDELMLEQLLSQLPSIRTSRAAASSQGAAGVGSARGGMPACGFLTPTAAALSPPSSAARSTGAALSAPVDRLGLQQQQQQPLSARGGCAGAGAGVGGSSSSTVSNKELELYAHALMNRMAELTQEFTPNMAVEVQQVMVQQVEQAARAAQLAGRPFGYTAAVRVLEQSRHAYAALLLPPELGRMGSGCSAGHGHGLRGAAAAAAGECAGDPNQWGAGPLGFAGVGSFSGVGSFTAGGYNSRRPSFTGGSLMGGSFTGGSFTGGSGGSFTRTSLQGGSFTGPSHTGPSPWNSFSSLRGSSITGPPNIFAAAVAAAAQQPNSATAAAAAAAAAAAGTGGGAQAAAAAVPVPAPLAAANQEQLVQQRLRSLATAAAEMGSAAEAEALAAAVAAVAEPQASGVASCEVSDGSDTDEVSNTTRARRRMGKARRR